jgi:CRP-like cAMP-binding protein
MASGAIKEEEILALFKEIPLFSGLSIEVQKAFIAYAAEKPVAKGQIIYVEDDQAEFFYVIKKGWVKLFRETFDGTEAVIDILTNLHLFGEFTIFDKGVYSSSAEAVEDSTLISFPTVFLKEQIKKDHTLAFNMLAAMSRHLKQQDRKIEHLTVQTASQRIGCFLLRLCPKNKENNIIIQLPYDKTLLASRLGMKPETFSRALNTLRDKTGIVISGARVEIGSINQLASFSCKGCSSYFPCENT